MINLIILLDIMMPGTSVREIIPKLKGYKVVYLSVVRTSEAEKEALMNSKTIVDFIQKPFDIDETLMVYDGMDSSWWRKKMVEYKDDEEVVLNEWLKHIESNRPKHTHEESFANLLKNINVKLY